MDGGLRVLRIFRSCRLLVWQFQLPDFVFHRFEFRVLVHQDSIFCFRQPGDAAVGEGHGFGCLYLADCSAKIRRQGFGYQGEGFQQFETFLGHGFALFPHGNVENLYDGNGGDVDFALFVRGAFK